MRQVQWILWSNAKLCMLLGSKFWPSLEDQLKLVRNQDWCAQCESRNVVLGVFFFFFVKWHTLFFALRTIICFINLPMFKAVYHFGKNNSKEKKTNGFKYLSKGRWIIVSHIVYSIKIGKQKCRCEFIHWE